MIVQPGDLVVPAFHVGPRDEPAYAIITWERIEGVIQHDDVLMVITVKDTVAGWFVLVMTPRGRIGWKLEERLKHAHQ